MTQCWSEGEIRAYLDSELPPRDMERVAAHVKECAACGGLRAELEIRAGQVSGLLDALTAPELAAQALPHAPRRSRVGLRWPGVAAGLAAALAVGLALMPKRADKAAIAPPPQVPVPAKVVTAPPPQPVAQYHDMLAPGLSFLRQKDPSHLRPHPQHREETRGHHRRVDPFRRAAQVDVVTRLVDGRQV